MAGTRVLKDAGDKVKNRFLNGVGGNFSEKTITKIR